MRKVSAVEGYRLWAETWDITPSAIVALETRWLAPWLRGLRGKIFVDVSGGAGRWMIQAHALGARVVGSDLSREMLLEARRKPQLAGKLVRADTRSIPFRNFSADLVLCGLSLGHMPPVESAIAELARLVRPRGVLIVTDFHPGSLEHGWKRTFRSHGELYELETHSYRPQQLFDSAVAAGLVLEEFLEPCFDEPERALFIEAGKPDLFDQVRRIPAVFLARWRRP